MPANYEFECSNCGWEGERYRNTKNCPKCGSKLKRKEAQKMTEHNSEEGEEKYLTEEEVGVAVAGLPACCGDPDIDLPNHQLAVGRILKKQMEKAEPLIWRDAIKFINSRVSWIKGILTTDISREEWNTLLVKLGLPPLPEESK